MRVGVHLKTHTPASKLGVLLSSADAEQDAAGLSLGGSTDTHPPPRESVQMRSPWGGSPEIGLRAASYLPKRPESGILACQCDMGMCVRYAGHMSCIYAYLYTVYTCTVCVRAWASRAVHTFCDLYIYVEGVARS
jgi:hypothetical protein